MRYYCRCIKGRSIILLAKKKGKSLLIAGNIIQVAGWHVAFICIACGRWGSFLVAVASPTHPCKHTSGREIRFPWVNVAAQRRSAFALVRPTFPTCANQTSSITVINSPTQMQLHLLLQYQWQKGDGWVALPAICKKFKAISMSMPQPERMSMSSHRLPFSSDRSFPHPQPGLMVELPAIS